MGWIFAGVGVGAGVSPPLITCLMLHHGWRSSFWVCAIIGDRGIHLVSSWPVMNPGKASLGFRIEREIDRSDLPAPRKPFAHGRQRLASRGENRLSEQRSLGGDAELFQFRIHRLDFLQLVLYLSGQGARAESEIERVLRHAAVSSDVGLQPAGRRVERPADQMAQPTFGTVRRRDGIDCPGPVFMVAPARTALMWRAWCLREGRGRSICRRVHSGR